MKTITPILRVTDLTDIPDIAHCMKRVIISADWLPDPGRHRRHAYMRAGFTITEHNGNLTVAHAPAQEPTHAE